MNQTLYHRDLSRVVCVKTRNIRDGQWDLKDITSFEGGLKRWSGILMEGRKHSIPLNLFVNEILPS